MGPSEEHKELAIRQPDDLDVCRFRSHVETRWDGKRLRCVRVLEERVSDASTPEGRFEIQRIEQDLGVVTEPMS
jgi:hypothetical protein